MRTPLIMFLGLMFTVGTLISLIIAGEWFGTSDVDTINSLTVMRPVDISIWTLSVPNLEYFTTGLSRMVTFNFAFFGGAAGILQFLLIMTIGGAVAWGIFVITIGVATNLLSRR